MLRKLPKGLDQQTYKPVIPASNATFNCEICNKELTLENAVSIKSVYALAGKEKAAFQCPDLQHFACCHEHAILANLHCVFEHIHTGPHAEYGSKVKHSKLTRIAMILNEPYGEDK